MLIWPTVPSFRPMIIRRERRFLPTLRMNLCIVMRFPSVWPSSVKVGFVAMSQTLKELEKKGIRGRILTTDYLTFSDPYALDPWAELSNVELKMYHVQDTGIGFHIKGYLFREEETYRIIGSSNMSQTALTANMEWNTALGSTQQGAMARSILQEFS